MSWTLLSFGKHKGKTLPEVALQDPDWVFWALFQPKLLIGRLRAQAEDVAFRASRIRVPERFGDKLVAHDNKGLRLVEPSTHGEHVLPYFDLSVARRLDGYKMGNCARGLPAVMLHVFGAADAQVTRRRAEGFFSDDANFVLDD